VSSLEWVVMVLMIGIEEGQDLGNRECCLLEYFPRCTLLLLFADTVKLPLAHVI